jgi:hypothetical protein
VPLHKLVLQNGINQQQTQTKNATSWFACNLIRWRDGMVEKIGGWQRLFNIQLAGLARSLHAFEDLTNTNDLLIGTDGGAQLYSGGALYNFTLLTADSNVAGANIATTASPLGFVNYVGTLFITGGFVGGTGQRVFYTSSNGTSWTPVTLSGIGSTINPLQFAFGNGIYVAVGFNTNTSVVSSDGVTWTAYNLTDLFDPTSLVFGNGTFVAAASTYMYTSTDGIFWRTRTSAHPYGWTSVAFGNSVFVAVTNASIGGSAYVQTSSDGITWTAQAGAPSALPSGYGWDRIDYCNNLFIAVSHAVTTNIMTSPDGVTWTKRTVPSGVYSASTYGSATYCIVGNQFGASYPTVLSSSDAITWTSRTSTEAGNAWVGVAFGNSLFVAVAAAGINYMMTSANAIAWSIQTYGNTNTVNVTDTNYAPAVGSQFTIPVTVAFGTTVVHPATYTVQSVPSVNNYTFTIATTLATGVSALPPSFIITSAQVGTDLVTVTLAGHGLSMGGFFTVDILTTIPASGVTIAAGAYLVTSVISSSAFIIAVPGQISTAINTSITYPNGNYEGQNNLTGAVPIWYPAVNFPAVSSNWYTDNLGQDGLIMYTGSPLFAWIPPVDAINVATNVMTASQINTGMMVAMPQAQVITFGSQPIIGSGAADPLLIRYSDAGGFTVWTATQSNQAGSYRLSRGSRIIGGIQLAITTIIWTDTDVWMMQYTGPPFVYSFTIVASGCGLLAPKAAAVLGSNVYWISQKQFYQAGSSGVQIVNCPVWDIIFNDIDPANVNKMTAGANSAFGEVIFNYASLSGGTGEVDSYVKFKPATGEWDYGSNHSSPGCSQYARTAWMDQSVFGSAMGGDLNKLIQQHEIGYDADGTAMAGVFAETGYADIADGDTIVTTNEIMPDLKWFGNVPGAIMVTLKGAMYAQGPVYEKGPYGMDMQNRHIRPRMRARSIALIFQWVARLGYSARIGAVRFRASGSGKRP